MVIGALIGGAYAAMTGGNIIQGMVMGAIGGLFMGAANAVVAAANLACTSLSSVATVALYASAGAFAGAVNAAIYGGDGGQAMLMGAVGGAAGIMVGGYVAGLQVDSTLKTVLQIGGSGVVGGGVAELSGGDFGEGFRSAAIAAAASMAVNKFFKENTKVNNTKKVDYSKALALTEQNTEITTDAIGIVLPTKTKTISWTLELIGHLSKRIFCNILDYQMKIWERDIQDYIELGYEPPYRIDPKAYDYCEWCRQQYKKPEVILN
jgi:hypothetical protein